MTKQALKVEQHDPNQLKPNPWNSNIVPPENEVKLEESIRRFGMFKPVVVRTLADGTMQIIGGEHRWQAAKRLKIEQIPVVNLGVISDKKAKEISLIDNGRYGADDTLQLAQILEDIGDIEEIASFMPYTQNDIDSIFSSVNIALDELDISDDEELPRSVAPEKKIQQHQIMRFKVPVEDAEFVADIIESIIKTQKFTDSDSLTNAGDALVHLVKEFVSK